MVRLAALLIAASVVAASAQQTKPFVVGFMDSGTPAMNPQNRETFRQALEGHGWVEGRNVVTEYRFADGRSERFPEMAADLVRLNVNVVVVAGEPMILAAKQATSTVPIVMAAVGDPVGRGFVTTLARPGGNITGVSNLAVDLSGKWVELLKEAMPAMSKVALLRNPASPTHAVFLKGAEEAARRLGLQPVPVEAKTAEEFDAALATVARERAVGLIVFPDPLFNGNRVKLATLAQQQRVPWITLFRDSAEAGALMSYGPSLRDNYRRAAAFVDKILRGARAAELPVEQARVFELVINEKSAKALGLRIPPSLLLRADHVFQ